MKDLWLGLFVLLVLSATQCRRTSALNCAAWAVEIQPEIEELTAAGQLYSSDPTKANCENYRQALSNYFNELERYNGCAFSTVDQQSFRESIDDARASLDDLSCD